MAEVHNGQDRFDSRDVQARIDELEAEREALVEAVTEAGDDTNCERAHDLPIAREELKDWDASDEADELRIFKALKDEAEGYCEWDDGVTFIRETYFIEYAQEFAEECCEMSANLNWPFTCIDWEKAARELKMDYTTVDFDDVKYLVRS